MKTNKNRRLIDNFVSEIVDAIQGVKATSTWKFQNVSLHSGHGGVVLFLAILCQEKKKERKYSALFEEHLTLLINNVADTATYKSDTFSDGLAGVGWLLMYLKDIDLLDEQEEDFFEPLNSHLSTSLDSMISQRNWDALHGALGVASYFIKQKRFDEVKKVVNFIYNIANQENREVKWSRFEESLGCDIYDLGLAHGMGSIILFLSKCYEENISRTISRKLLVGAFNFYINNLQQYEVVGSFYCNYIAVAEYPIHLPKLGSRPAWCYGDLGILYSLYLGAVRLKEKELITTFEGMLKVLAEDIPSYKARVEELTLCHGSVGLATIFNRVFEISKDVVFQKASKSWRDISLIAISNNGDHANAFSSMSSDELFSFEFLNGHLGVAIGLIAHLQKNDKRIDYWKEALFLL